MPTGEYLEGAAVFASMLAGAGAGAVLICRRRMPWLRGAPRALALGTLITLGVLSVHLLPAMLGVLSREAVLVTTALGVLVAMRVPPGRLRRVETSPAPSPGAEPRAAWVLSGAVVCLTTLFGAAMALDQAVIPPGSIDMLNFHLPGVGAWMQSGSIWQVDNFVANIAPGNYPNNGDILLLAAVLPWSNDFLSHLAIYPFWALAGVAVFALATELRAPRPAAAVAGCLLLATPAVAIPALVHSYPDAVLLASFGTGVLFLMRHQRSGARAELVLAGLALGVAFGTKWYGVSSVAVVVAVWGVARLLAGSGWGRVVRQGALVVGLVMLAGGVWLLRNWSESGNPFFPVSVSPLGIEIFDAPRDFVREAFGFTIADYIDDPDVWADAILPQYREALAAACGLLLGGTLIALGRIARRRATLAAHARPGALAAGGVALGIVYAITPYTAGGLAGEPVLVGADARYLIPAVLVGGALAAWVTRAARWGQIALAALALPALIDGVRLSSDGSNSYAVLEARQWLLAAAALAILVVGAGLAVRLRPFRGPWRAAFVVATTLALVGVVLVGNEIQQRFNDGRYLGADPTTDHLLTRVPAGSRIGLAGGWNVTGIAPPLPAFGPRYRNEVDYVGRDVEGMQREYGEGEGFVMALERGAYDYLVVGRGGRPKPFVSEERWAQSVGFERVVASERLALYRAPGA